MTLAELAGRVKTTQYAMTEILKDWAAAGIVECLGEHWALTAIGEWYGRAALDLRPLGHDDGGEVKISKHASMRDDR